MAEQRLSDLCRTMTDNGFPARLEGRDRPVHAVNTLEGAREGELSFLSNPKYLSAVATTGASAVVVKDDVALPAGLSAIRCADPYGAITVAIITLHGHRRHPQWGLSERATVHPSAKLGKNPNIAAQATIAEGAVVGDNCTIYPGCYVGSGVRIGNDCTLFPNVVIYENSELGDRVTIHAGSVIGEDGLGYAPHHGKWVKIPQVGRAILGNDVEIGANCTIDRATLGQTEIGDGSKFGNVVVIGHGTKVGPDCMFVGLIGVAGSVTVGRHVTLAGQVGVGGHITIGDEVTAGAQTGIFRNVAPETKLLGYPAIPLENARRSMAVHQRLPDWVRRIRDLEREVRELREKVGAETRT